MPTDDNGARKRGGGAILGQESRRVLPALGLAVLLPMIIFLSLQFGFNYRAERAAVEATALERARRIMSNVDANLERSKATARVLTTIRSINEHDWREADARTREIMALNADWRSVRFWDLDSRREVVDTRRPYGPPRPLDAATLARLDLAAPIIIGGIEDSCFCIRLSMPVIRDGRPRYLLIIELASADFQQLLQEQAPKEGVTAIVDSRGNFIARTLNYQQRVARPASRFVRDAIRHGTSGFYSGTTLEGVDNYTAFATSPSTKWSTHIAVLSSTVEEPQRLWRIATILAAVVSLLLAAGLFWFGLRVMVSQRRSAERLQQAQRLEAIGKLTGGIAQ